VDKYVEIIPRLVKFLFSKDLLDKVKIEREKWVKGILNKFVAKGEIKDKFETPSGIPLKHLYGLEDIEDIDYLDDIDNMQDLLMLKEKMKDSNI